MGEIEFNYGPLSDPLEKQANGYGLTLGEKAEYLDGLRVARLKLYFAEMLTPSQSEQAAFKLHKLATKEIKRLEATE